ncbi:MAG: helix-turn-helix domain-containing protein [Bacilli bacterium]|nr:helix-turn-helix domain-containing protein [Bacilli bacterium]
MRRAHVVVESWMIDYFGLTGDELIIYSIIYGFSQDGKSMYMGSRDYLCKWTKCTVRTVQRILTDMVDKKLIERYVVVGQKTRGYKVNMDKIEECIKDDEIHRKSFPEVVDEEKKKVNQFI